MNKNIIIGSLVFLFCILLPLKINSVEAFAATETYSLDEAIDRALSQNSGINLLEEKINLAEEKVSEASGLDREKRENELYDLEYQLDQKIEEVKIEVTRLYHTILIKRKQAALQADVADRLNKEYLMKQQQLELGKATAIDVAAAEINKSDAESRLQSLNNEVKGLIMDLNIIMGNDPSDSLALKDESIPEDSIRINDIEELADEMVDLSPKIQSLIREKELESRYDKADGDTIIGLQYDIEDKQNEVESNVYIGYNAVLNKRDDAAIKQLDHDKLQRLAEVARIKLDNGLISQLDFDKASQDAENAWNLLLLSKLDYYVEVKKYKLFIEPAQ